MGPIEPASSQISIDVVQAEIVITDSPRAVLGKVLEIKGRLTEDGSPAGNRNIELEWPEEGIVETSTDDEGKFVLIREVDVSSELGRRTFTIRAPNQGSGAILTSETLVVSEVNIQLSAPEQVSPGETVEILIEMTDEAGRPVTGLPVMVDGIEQSESSSEDGALTVSLTVPDPVEEQVWSVLISSPATDQYLSSTVTVVADIKRGLSSWVYLVILGVGLLGVFSGAGTLWFVNNRRSTLGAKIEDASAPVATLAEVVPASVKSDITGTGDTGDTDDTDLVTVVDEDEENAPTLAETRLLISLDQETDDLPGVIGIGESVTITAILTSEEDSPIAGLSLSIEIGGHGSWDQDTDKGGSVSVETETVEVGEHRVSVRFEGDEQLSAAESNSTIWVIEYREAITDIYNRLLEQVRASGIELDIQATPREVERNLVTGDTAIDEKLLDDLISVFEEADYSLHEILRDDFLKARRAFEGLEIRSINTEAAGESQESEMEATAEAESEATAEIDSSRSGDDE